MAISSTLRVSLGVPTIDSGGHIEQALARLAQQIAVCPPAYDIDLIVCVNGVRGARATIDALERFALAHPSPRLEIVVETRPGKNDAMNAVLRRLRARSSPPDLVFFFDDDVLFDPGTLARNIDALLAHEAAYGAGPVLVGAALRVVPLTWGDARRRHPGSTARALRAWLLHQVFAFPYRDDAPVPRFCEGMALGARLSHLPDLPASASGIGDDTFLSNTFALAGRKQLLERGVHSLLKPPGSIGRVELSADLEIWRGQQVRTHIGLELSWRHFDAERAFLARYLAWPFAFNPDSRLPFRPRTCLDALRYGLYMRLHAQNRARALELLRQGHTPAWCLGEADGLG